MKKKMETTMMRSGLRETYGEDVGCGVQLFWVFAFKVGSLGFQGVGLTLHDLRTWEWMCIMVWN